MITPSISVLSALEGTETVTSAVKPYILPLAVVILAGLFAAQPFGTASIGTVFGPVMLVWFAVIGTLGAVNLVARPSVLSGLDPLIGLRFLIHHGWGSFVVLGGVFLALTGAEALYADMGHIGRRPVRGAWLAIVFPALLLSYAGQVAFMDAHQDVKGNPFFASIPPLLVLPVVVLATCATIIASQAIITGTFTLTRQAMQLGWFPGLNIRQTSDVEYGQIYVPVVNWIMMLGTIAIAIGFKSSDNLSGAYGTAVSTTMLMTTALIYDVMRVRWRWSVVIAAPIALFFLAVDVAFFSANLLKIVQGGYVPLAIGVALFTIMIVWHKGIGLVRDGLAPLGDRVDEVLAKLRNNRDSPSSRFGGVSVALGLRGAAADGAAHCGFPLASREGGGPFGPFHGGCSRREQRAGQDPCGDGRRLASDGLFRLRRSSQSVARAGECQGTRLRHRPRSGALSCRQGRYRSARNAAAHAALAAGAVRADVPQRGAGVGSFRAAEKPAGRDRAPGRGLKARRARALTQTRSHSK